MRRLLRPVSDTKAAWTEVPGGSAYTALDEAIDTTTAGTTTDRIETATNAQTCELEFETFTLGSETVRGAALWVYAKAGSARNISIALEDDTGERGSAIVTSTTYGWVCAPFIGALSQTNIDNLSARIVSQTDGTAGTPEVATVFIEVLSHTLADAALAAYLGLVDLDPAVLWVPEASGAVVPDHSGNFRHGDLTGNYAAAASLLDGGQASIELENNVVSGVRARDYSPFAVDSARTLICLINQESQYGAPTTFAGSGVSGASPNTPHPTWEFIDSGLIRFYGTVNTYPLTFDDVRVGGALGQNLWLIFSFDDAESLGRAWADFQLAGALGPKGYGVGGYGTGNPINYDAAASAGLLQFGYRGNGSTFETFDGKVEFMAVMEGLITPAQVQELAIAAGYGGRERFEVADAGLNNEIGFDTEDLVISIPRRKGRWLGSPDTDGEVLAEEARFENRQIKARVRVRDVDDMDAALDRVGEIVDALQACERTPGGAEVIWSPAGSTRALTFYALSGEIEEMPITPTGELAGWFVEAPVLSIVLTCRPFGYGPEESVDAVTQATPLVVLDVTNVGGDVAAEGRLTIAAVTQNRRRAQWGLGGAYTFLLDSDDLTVSGFAGAQTTRTGAYDPNASGNNVIRATIIPGAAAGVCGTGAQTHVGHFRALARLWAADAGTRVRFVYRVGSGPAKYGEWQTVPGADAFYEVDLGPVTIEELSTGTHAWSGEIQAMAADVVSTIDVDYVCAFPAGYGYGVARSLPASGSGVLDSYDDFQGGSGDLSGRTSVSADTWGTAGQAGDFQESGSGVISRAIGSASSLTQGRHGVIGSTLGDSQAQVDVIFGGMGGDAYLLAAVLLRYVDPSNFLALGLYVTETRGQYSVIKRVAGVETPLYDGTGSTTTSTAWLAAESVAYRIRPSVNSAGEWSLGIGPQDAEDAFGVITDYDADLATGGALDDGQAGITHAETSATGATVVFGGFSASGLAAADPVIVSGGATLEVCHDEVRRLNLVYGEPNYRGTGFYLPPGDSRVAVAARRVDTESYPASAVTDSTTVRAYWRERFLAVPR